MSGVFCYIGSNESSIKKGVQNFLYCDQLNRLIPMVYIQTPACVVAFNGTTYTASMSGKTFTESLLSKLIEVTESLNWLMEDDFWFYETSEEVVNNIEDLPF